MNGSSPAWNSGDGRSVGRARTYTGQARRTEGQRRRRGKGLAKAEGILILVEQDRRSREMEKAVFAAHMVRIGAMRMAVERQPGAGGCVGIRMVDPGMMVTILAAVVMVVREGMSVEQFPCMLDFMQGAEERRKHGALEADREHHHHAHQAYTCPVVDRALHVYVYTMAFRTLQASGFA